MNHIQSFEQGNKMWFREFADKHGITFNKLKTEIFPHTKVRTLEKLWQRQNAAHGAYADVLIWYAKAKHKDWTEMAT